MIGPEEGDSKDNLGVVSVWVGLICGGLGFTLLVKHLQSGLMTGLDLPLGFS